MRKNGNKLDTHVITTATAAAAPAKNALSGQQQANVLALITTIMVIVFE